MEKKTESWKNQGHHILQVPSHQKFRTHSKTVWWETQNLSSSEVLGITFDSKFTFQKYFEEILGHCNTRYHWIRLLVNKKGTQPVHHITNLQTTCPANFRIWLPFNHNNIRHNHQQNLMATEQIYFACPAFTKIHQCKATTWLIWPSVRER